MDKAVVDRFSEIGKSITSSQFERLNGSLSGLSNAAKRMALEKSDVSAIAHQDLSKFTEGMKDIASGLNRQKALFSQLDNIRPLQIQHDIQPRLSLPEPPDNPIYQTNERLGELEERLQTMTKIMEEGMKIAANQQEIAASNAQSAAASTLAAAENTRIAKYSLIATGLATLLSLAAIVMQTVSSKQSDQKQAAVLTQVTSEFKTLREAELSSASQIAKALEKSETNIVKAIVTDKAQNPADSDKTKPK